MFTTKILRKQHQEIECILAEIKTLIQENRSGVHTAKIVGNLERLISKLKFHLRMEQDYLYPRIMTRKDRINEYAVICYMKEMWDFRFYMVEFNIKYNTNAKVRLNYEVFRAEFNSLSRYIEELFLREEDELFDFIKCFVIFGYEI